MKSTALILSFALVSSAALADGPGPVIIEPEVIAVETAASSGGHGWVVLLLTLAAACAAIGS